MTENEAVLEIAERDGWMDIPANPDETGVKFFRIQRVGGDWITARHADAPTGEKLDFLAEDEVGFFWAEDPNQALIQPTYARAWLALRAARIA